MQDRALEAPALIDGVARARAHVVAPPDALAPEVDDGEIRIKADGNTAFAMRQAHGFGRRIRQQARDAAEWHAARVMALGQHHGKKRLKARTARRSLPDAARLRRQIAV